MFRRFTLLGTALLLMVLAALPALAQDDWFVLLHNGSDNQFLRVDADGTQTTYSLDLPEGVFVGARNMAFSPDGNEVAFCAIQYSENGAQSTTTLSVRDLAAGTTLMTQELGSSLGCIVKSNEDFSLLAVGMIRYYAGDPQADTSQSPWELLLVDAATGETVDTLNAQSSLASTIEYRYGESFLPFIFRVDDEGVLFGEVPYGTEFPPDFPTYAWQYEADTLEATEQPELLFSDYLPSTGELAWLEADESLPAGQPMGPMPQNNVVNITDDSGETTMVYHSPDWVIASVEFLNGGERLMLSLVPPFDENNPDQVLPTRWIALDRQGNVSDLYSAPGFATLAPAPDGYVVFYTTSETLPATYHLEYHAEGGIESLLSFELDYYGGWEIAYVTPTAPAEDLPPFTPVNP